MATVLQKSLSIMGDIIKNKPIMLMSGPSHEKLCCPPSNLVALTTLFSLSVGVKVTRTRTARRTVQCVMTRDLKEFTVCIMTYWCSIPGVVDEQKSP